MPNPRTTHQQSLPPAHLPSPELDGPDRPLASLSAGELLARCGAHDCVGAWEEFDRRYGRPLTRTIRRTAKCLGRLTSRELREDLLQDFYCKLLSDDRRRLYDCRGDDDETVTGYLCRIAEHVVIDHYRASLALKRGRDLVLPGGDASEGPVAWAHDPQARADRRTLLVESLRLFFRRGGRALPGPNARRDLWATYWATFEGWTSREIAERLALNANCVDSIIYRTRERLAASGIDLRAVMNRRAAS